MAKHVFTNASQSVKNADLVNVEQDQAVELTASELLLAPTNTLSKINSILDILTTSLSNKIKADKNGTFISKDIKALGELVKANATLRETQLKEDYAAKQANSIASDEQIAALLFEALKASGPSGLRALQDALNTNINTNSNKQLGAKAPHVESQSKSQSSDSETEET